MIRFAFLLALTLVSCSSSCCPGWQTDWTVTHCERYDSARAVFPTCNAFNEMEIEIVRSYSGVRVYGNIRSLPIRSGSLFESTISIDGITSPIDVDLFEGGQRILFSTDTATLIIASLEEGKNVTLTVGRYRANLTSENFCNGLIID